MHSATRDLLPTPLRRRLPVAGRCRRGDGRHPAAARRRSHMDELGSPAADDRSCRRGRRRRRRQPRRDPPGCRHRSDRRAGRVRRQRVIRDRRRAHEAVPDTTEPHRCDRLAADDRWRAPRAAGDARRRRTAVDVGQRRCRRRLPQPRRHRRRVRRLVQRHPAPSLGGTSAARPRRTDHRRCARLDRARGVAVTDAAHRLRNHGWRDRVRRSAAGPGGDRRGSCGTYGLGVSGPSGSDRSGSRPSARCGSVRRAPRRTWRAGAGCGRRRCGRRRSTRNPTPETAASRA